MTDPLSDFLSVVRVKSMMSARLEARGAWAFRYPAYRHMKFGALLQGERWVWVDGGEPVHMKAGDFYLLTDGRPYCIASDLSAPVTDGVAALASVRVPAGVMRYGEGDPLSVAAAGRFEWIDDEVAKLLSFLPPLVRIPSEHPDSATLAALVPLIIAETDTIAPGMACAASSIAALVLVHILRAHMTSPNQPPNWLTATTVPGIGRALTLMHEQVSHPWTVEEIANQVGLSRTAFAQKFRERVGIPPLTYLMQWRITLARAALRAGERNIAALAERLGYGSDTAFRIAFKRETGVSPGKFRQM